MPYSEQSTKDILCTATSCMLTSEPGSTLARGSACPASLLLKTSYTAPQHLRRFSGWLKKFQSYGKGRQE